MSPPTLEETWQLLDETKQYLVTFGKLSEEANGSDFLNAAEAESVVGKLLEVKEAKLKKLSEEKLKAQMELYGSESDGDAVTATLSEKETIKLRERKEKMRKKMVVIEIQAVCKERSDHFLKVEYVASSIRALLHQILGNDVENAPQTATDAPSSSIIGIFSSRPGHEDENILREALEAAIKELELSKQENERLRKRGPSENDAAKLRSEKQRLRNDLEESDKARCTFRVELNDMKEKLAAAREAKIDLKTHNENLNVRLTDEESHNWKLEASKLRLEILLEDQKPLVENAMKNRLGFLERTKRRFAHGKRIEVHGRLDQKNLAGHSGNIDTELAMLCSNTLPRKQIPKCKLDVTHVYGLELAELKVESIPQCSTLRRLLNMHATMIACGFGTTTCPNSNGKTDRFRNLFIACVSRWKEYDGTGDLQNRLATDQKFNAWYREIFGITAETVKMEKRQAYVAQHGAEFDED